MSEKVKNCPFCGGKAMLIEYKPMKADICHYCICENCLSSGDTYDTPNKAIKAWNNRQIEDEKDNQIKELTDDLAFSKKWTKIIEDLEAPKSRVLNKLKEVKMSEQKVEVAGIMERHKIIEEQNEPMLETIRRALISGQFIITHVEMQETTADPRLPPNGLSIVIESVKVKGE